ncbi:antitoxin Xre/MbcA/ParS-like domain-containing protein [Neoaquamicrobium sediminum]|uniref:Antitoxin Xre/MbcA/ParS-like middle domain-containing protein n=1 Tax=Neoaquamicrobium sediminum TaxID=1849104 RepID=A0ABV3X0A0_9HYPH
MASPNTQIDRNGRARVAERVTTKVTDALKSDGAFESGSLALSARIAGAAAAAVVNLPVEARQKLTKRQTELVRGIRRLVETFSEDPGQGKIELPVPETVEPSNGEGLGPIVSADEGNRLLAEFAVARKIEDWAGPVAGASELSRNYGIPRSTLHRWQHADEVIGLLKGTRKHVFPVEQLIDGRPARGISAIVGLAGSHRVAWLWLRQSNPVLGSRKPIDLLKHDRVDEVVDTARAYFSPQ